jgi:wyosine [tRNA(Phe)-imidazoG37] synthetase (radical SAM superfamily)
MKYVYGPVPSRRLGQSLGIDTIPLKTCNWNCVYCQLGRTRPLTNERRDYYPPHQVIAEIKQAIHEHKPGEINWVTFVGSGEPTLHASIGWLIRRTKEFTKLPVAVITNGSFLYMEYHRQEMAYADAVLPSFDAGNSRLYRKINRPHPHFTFDRQVEGLKAFSNQYLGELWIEVMLVKGLNDSKQELSDIASVLHYIEPDEIHINLPTRPPVERWVKPPDENGIQRAKSILGDVARVVTPTQGKFYLNEGESMTEAIMAIITRHPMEEKQLIQTIEGNVQTEATKILQELRASGQAQIVERNGRRYWTAAPAYFPH